MPIFYNCSLGTTVRERALHIFKSKSDIPRGAQNSFVATTGNEEAIIGLVKRAMARFETFLLVDDSRHEVDEGDVGPGVDPWIVASGARLPGRYSKGRLYAPKFYMSGLYLDMRVIALEDLRPTSIGNVDFPYFSLFLHKHYERCGAVQYARMKRRSAEIIFPI